MRTEWDRLAGEIRAELVTRGGRPHVRGAMSGADRPSIPLLAETWREIQRQARMSNARKPAGKHGISPGQLVAWIVEDWIREH